MHTHTHTHTQNIMIKLATVAEKSGADSPGQIIRAGEIIRTHKNGWEKESPESERERVSE